MTTPSRPQTRRTSPAPGMPHAAQLPSRSYTDLYHAPAHSTAARPGAAHPGHASCTFLAETDANGTHHVCFSGNIRAKSRATRATTHAPRSPTSVHLHPHSWHTRKSASLPQRDIRRPRRAPSRLGARPDLPPTSDRDAAPDAPQTSWAHAVAQGAYTHAISARSEKNKNASFSRNSLHFRTPAHNIAHCAPPSRRAAVGFGVHMPRHARCRPVSLSRSWGRFEFRPSRGAPSGGPASPGLSGCETRPRADSWLRWPWSMHGTSSAQGTLHDRTDVRRALQCSRTSTGTRRRVTQASGRSCRHSAPVRRGRGRSAPPGIARFQVLPSPATSGADFACALDKRPPLWQICPSPFQTMGTSLYDSNDDVVARSKTPRTSCARGTARRATAFLPVYRPLPRPGTRRYGTTRRKPLRACIVCVYSRDGRE